MFASCRPGQAKHIREMFDGKMAVQDRAVRCVVLRGAWRISLDAPTPEEPLPYCLQPVCCSNVDGGHSTGNPLLPGGLLQISLVGSVGTVPSCRVKSKWTFLSRCPPSDVRAGKPGQPCPSRRMVGAPFLTHIYKSDITYIHQDRAPRKAACIGRDHGGS